MKYTLEDYRHAPSGIGPLATEWNDKPHRLFYDLIRAVIQLQSEVVRLESIVSSYAGDASSRKYNQ